MRSLAGVAGRPPEIEADKQRDAHRARMRAMLDNTTCDAGDVVRLILQYERIGEWDPQRGTYPLQPDPPELPFAA